MIKAKTLDWDSDFFKLKVGRVDLNRGESIEKGELEKYDLVYIFSIEEIESQLDSLKLIEVKRTYECDLNQTVFQKIKSSKIHSTEETSEDLLKLVMLSGKYSRFRRDDRIPFEKFKNLYYLWIEKSLCQKSVLVYRDKESILGFISYSIKNDIGKIELIAVSPEAQGKGVASHMIQYVHQVFRDNGANKAVVVTQADNSMACALYEKQDYRILKEENLYHYWK